MNWLETQEFLEKLNEKWIDFENNKIFLSNDQNYETSNDNINRNLFYLVKSIKKKMNEMPKSDEDLRRQIMSLGNDNAKVIELLKKVSTDFDTYERGIEIFETLREISDKEYVYKEGYENSFRHRYQIDSTSKLLEVYYRDDLSIEEKYNYVDSFDKTLSDEDAGELHVQVLIGKDENNFTQNQIQIMLLNAMVHDAPDRFSASINSFHQATLEVGAFGEKKMDNEPLEEHLKWYRGLLVCPFVKSIKNNKNHK